MALAILKRGMMYYLKAAYTDKRAAINKGLQLVKSKICRRFLVKTFRGRYELWITK